MPEEEKETRRIQTGVRSPPISLQEEEEEDREEEESEEGCSEYLPRIIPLISGRVVVFLCTMRSLGSAGMETRQQQQQQQEEPAF